MVASEIRPTSDRGLATFATRSFKKGQTVFEEAALLAVETTQAAQFGGFEKEFSVLDAERQNAVLDLEDVSAKHDLDEDSPEKKKSLRGILETNGVLRDSDGATVLGKRLARLNHSCRPNVSVHFFEDEPDRLRVFALRDIDSGEELCQTYCDLLQTSEERQTDLASYGFECACSDCVCRSKNKKVGAEDNVRVVSSDASRRNLQNLTRQIQEALAKNEEEWGGANSTSKDQGASSRKKISPEEKPNSSVINLITFLFEQLKKIGLECPLYGLMYGGAAFEESLVVGDIEAAKKWAAVVLEAHEWACGDEEVFKKGSAASEEAQRLAGFVQNPLEYLC